MYKFLIADYSDEFGTVIDTQLHDFPSWEAAEQYCKEHHQQSMSKLFVKGFYLSGQLITDRRKLTTLK